MKRYLLLALSCAFFVIGVVSGAPAAAHGPHAGHGRHLVKVYKATRLIDPVTQAQFGGLDLNNRGEVVGSVNRPNFSGFQAAVRRRGEVIRLPELADTTSSQATATNDRGDIVGTDTLGSQGTVPVIWRRNSGTVEQMGSPAPGAIFQPIRLNFRRQAIGFTNSGQYLWEAGNFTLLEPGPDGRNPFAEDLNNAGHIAGWDVTTGVAHTRAVLWREGAVELLGVLPGMTDSRAEGLNDFDHVVGDSINLSTSSGRAFIWRQGEMKALSLVHDVAGETSSARNINLWGQIVGYENLAGSAGNSIAVLWERGRAFDLNTLIRAADALPEHFRLTSAYRINEWGQILATGSGRSQRHRRVHVPADPNIRMAVTRECQRPRGAGTTWTSVFGGLMDHPHIRRH